MCEKGYELSADKKTCEKIPAPVPNSAHSNPTDADGSKDDSDAAADINESFKM